MIRSRQAEGIALARSKGVYKKIHLTDGQIKVMVARARTGQNKGNRPVSHVLTEWC